MPNLFPKFLDDGTLEATLFLRSGWKRAWGNYVSRGNARIDRNAGWWLNVQVTMEISPFAREERPAFLDGLRDDLKIEGGGEDFRYTLTKFHLVILVPEFPQRVNWFDDTRKAGMKSTIRRPVPEGYFEIRFWAFYHPPTGVEVNDARQWESMAASAGLLSHD